MEADIAEGSLTLRPPVGTQVALWVVAVVGLLFGLSGFAAGSDLAGGIAVGLFGLYMFGMSAAKALSLVRFSSTSGIRYRSGWVRRVPRDDVVALTLGSVVNPLVYRTCLVVERRSGKPLKMRSVDCSTDRGRIRLERQAAVARRVMGLELAPPVQ